MPQMFLQHPYPIAGIVLFNSHNRKGIPEPVRTDIVYLAALGVDHHESSHSADL